VLASQVPDAAPVTVTVSAHGRTVATGRGRANFPLSVTIPKARLWSPETPFLYNISISYHDDTVLSYFGMREVSLCRDSQGVTRPCINGEYRFLTGVLDQVTTLPVLLLPMLKLVLLLVLLLLTVLPLLVLTLSLAHT